MVSIGSNVRKRSNTACGIPIHASGLDKMCVVVGVGFFFLLEIIIIIIISSRSSKLKSSICGLLSSSSCPPPPQKRSVARNFSSTASLDASSRSVACMYLAMPTRLFLSASKLDEYNIFILIFADSGHLKESKWTAQNWTNSCLIWKSHACNTTYHDTRMSFCFWEPDAVPWHWCWYS